MIVLGKESLDWIRVSSGKLNDPEAVVACSHGDGGFVQVSYLEVDGRFVEAHLYCDDCGTEAWVRNPRPPSDEQRGNVRRYGGGACGS